MVFLIGTPKVLAGMHGNPDIIEVTLQTSARSWAVPSIGPMSPFLGALYSLLRVLEGSWYRLFHSMSGSHVRHIIFLGKIPVEDALPSVLCKSPGCGDPKG